MSEIMYRCTLPDCQCEEFAAGKSQLKTCDRCKHGWAAHDLISEAQAKKIRKRGAKDGTPCQVGICACGNYQRPPGVAKTSWLAVCDNCKHSETEHRYPTKLDKAKKHNHEKAADHACVGCEMQCPGFHPKEDSAMSTTTSQAAKKCGFCNHVIDTHRTWLALDSFISDQLDACSGLRCHCSVPPRNKQMRQSGRDDNVDDDAFLSVWLEPTNIDPDEDVPFLDANVCQCKGFTFDDMARICNQYYGFTEGVVGPHLPNLACQCCSHALKHHRPHTGKEQEQLDSRKVNNLTMVGVVSLAAASVPGYPDNVALSLHDEFNKTSQKLLLAATTLSNSNDVAADEKNTISVSSAIFDVPRSHHRLDRLPSVCSAGDVNDHQSDDEKENDVHKATTSTGGKKRGRKMSKIVGDVKKKIKRRRLGSKGTSLASESDTEGLDEEDPTGRMSRSLSRLGNDVMASLPQRSKVTATAWSHQKDACPLAICTDDLSLKIHRGSDELAAASFLQDTQLSTCISWSHSNKWLVSGHVCGATFLWKINNTPGMTVEPSLLTQSCAKSKVTSICISGDDRYIALGHQNSEVLIFDTRKGGGLSSDHGGFIAPQLLSTCSILYGSVLCMAWHPSKLLLVAGGEDDQVTVFYMKKPASQSSRGTLKHFFIRSPRRPTKKGFHQCAILKGHKSFVGAVTFDPSGAFLLSAGWDGQLLFWDVADIDDAIESDDDVDCEIVCSSGFVMGRSSRGQNLNGTLRPFVPQAIALFAAYAVVMLRTSVNRISLAMYEIPKKYSELSAKIE